MTMRTCAVCILICMLGALVSCNSSHHYPSQLTTVDSLCEVSPDSAQALLQTLAKDTATMPEDARMYYKLLTIRAADKLYQPHTSDSLIRLLVNYYEHGGDPKLLPIAYYYAGSVYRDLNDAPQALDYFQKAVDTDDESLFLHTKSKAYSQMGQLFIVQRLRENALESFRNSYEDDVKRNDTLGQIFNLRDIAFCLARTMPDSMPDKYYEAIRLAKAIHREDMVADVHAQLADFYLGYYGDAKSALPHIRIAINFDDPRNQRSVGVIASKVYKQLGDMDSLHFFSRRLLTLNDDLALQEAAKGLSDYYDYTHNMDSLHKYTQMYRQITDTISQHSAEHAIAQMHSLYKYEKQEKTIIQLEHKNQINKMLMIGLIVIFISVAIAAYIFIKNIRLRNESMKLKLEKYEARFHHSDVKQENKQDIVLDKEPAVIRFKDLVNNLAVIKMETIKEDDWIYLRDAITKKYPTFEKELHELCKMSERDFHICLLLKAGFQSSDISKLLRITNNNLYSACRKLFKRSFGIEKSYNEWKNVIERI